MNTMIKMLAAATALVAGSAQAQLYVQGSVGSAKWSLSCDAGVSCDKSGTYVRLLGGYAFGNGLAIEMGFTDYGKSQAKATTAQARKGQAYLEADFKAEGPILGVAYHLPVGAGWAMAFRGGVVGMKTAREDRSDLGSEVLEDRSMQTYVGMGVNYAVAKYARLELGLDLTRARLRDEKGNLRNLSMGLRAQF